MGLELTSKLQTLLGNAREGMSTTLGYKDDMIKAKNTANTEYPSTVGATTVLNKNEEDQLKKDFGNRPDGTKKGSGYLGVLKRPDGNVSTEISMSFDDVNNGKDIPLLVPTLTKKEIDTILTIDPKDPDFNRKVPKSAIDKAIDHANMRIKKGKSVFAD